MALYFSAIVLSCVLLTTAHAIPPVSVAGPASILPETLYKDLVVQSERNVDGHPAETIQDAGSGLDSSTPSDVAVQRDTFQQMKRTVKATITVLSSLIAYVSINSLARAYNPGTFIWSEEDKDELAWIATSRSWWGRKACRWLGLCGVTHFEPASARFGQRGPDVREEEQSWQSYWVSGQNGSATWDDAEHARRSIPDYVYEYAPLVHLYSDEQFWPCDIAEHLFHVTPSLNYTPIQSRSNHSTLHNLDQLNQWQDGENVFLTSNDNVEDRPPWLEGEKNIPSGDRNGEPWPDIQLDEQNPGDTVDERVEWYDAGKDPQDETPPAHNRDEYDFVRQELRRRGEPIQTNSSNGRSDAPAVLLVVDKGNGIVDAFWFYFYSFNLGNVVFNVRFGNHVGDWEHCLVRFYHGKPKALFFSAHSAGEAYSYKAIEKFGKRVSGHPRILKDTL